MVFQTFYCYLLVTLPSLTPLSCAYDFFRLISVFLFFYFYFYYLATQNNLQIE